MNGTNTFIQHALNGGEVTIDLLNGKKVTVDSYCAATNCVYEFHGCYNHGCPARYKSSAPTPHRVCKTTNHKRGTVYEHLKFGNLLSNTITQMKISKRLALILLKCGKVSGITFVRSFSYQHQRKNSNISAVSFHETLILKVEKMLSNCITDVMVLTLFTIWM